MERGGAIEARNNSTTLRPLITLKGEAVIENCSAARGGAISAESSELRIEGGIIRNCHADQEGGAVYMAPYAAVSVTSNTAVVFLMSSGQIQNCSSDSDGGGIYYRSTQYGNDTASQSTMHTFEITGGEIEKCTAKAMGGGIFLRGSTTIAQCSVYDVSGLELSGCKAGTSGGGICIQYAKSDIHDIF